MRTRSLASLLGVCIVLGFSSVAAHAFQHGSHTWTAVSGYSGQHKREVIAKSNTKTIYAIKGYEEADDPVYLEAHQNIMGIDSTTYYGGLKLIVRHGWNLGSLKSASVGPSRYIIALNVCTTDQKESNKRKIKGIRIWPGRINANGTVSSDGAFEEWRRTNCKKWRNKVSCGPNQVVTGLRGHYKFEVVGFSGISLRCTEVR